MVSELNFLKQVAFLISRNFYLYFILISSFIAQRCLQVNQRKAGTWGPKKQLPCKCMAGNPILENSPHSPEIMLGYPRDNVVLLRWSCSLVMYIVLWSSFPQRSEVFTREWVIFCRFLLCHSAQRVLMKGYHFLLIEAKDNSEKPNGSWLLMSTCPIHMWTAIHFTTGVKNFGRCAEQGDTNR